MKREFAFDDALRMLEVMWSSLPPDPPKSEIILFEQEFMKSPTVVSPRPKENAYTKVIYHFILINIIQSLFYLSIFYCWYTISALILYQTQCLIPPAFLKDLSRGLKLLSRVCYHISCWANYPFKSLIQSPLKSLQFSQSKWLQCSGQKDIRLGTWNIRTLNAKEIKLVKEMDVK